jgi:hypothetical protein
MVQICKYPCNSLQDARTEERKHYELLLASLNSRNPCRTKDEWYQENKDRSSENAKIHRQEHKDSISEDCKKYYQINKDKILKKNKKSNEKNRDKLLEGKRKYYEKNRDKLLEKMKTYSVEHKVEISDRGKIYREKNKDMLLEKQKIYREKNKHKILCCCGSNIRKLDKSSHEKSIKHIQFIQNNNLCEIVNPESINV